MQSIFASFIILCINRITTTPKPPLTTTITTIAKNPLTATTATSTTKQQPHHYKLVRKRDSLKKSIIKTTGTHKHKALTDTYMYLLYPVPTNSCLTTPQQQK